MEAHKRFILAPWPDIQHREKSPARAASFLEGQPECISLFVLTRGAFLPAENFLARSFPKFHFAAFFSGVGAFL